MNGCVCADSEIRPDKFVSDDELKGKADAPSIMEIGLATLTFVIRLFQVNSMMRISRSNRLHILATIFQPYGHIEIY